MDTKTALNQFCQRLCQRPVTRADIEYTVNKIGAQFQAIVKLNCVQGQEFAGELSANPKDAEKAAAEQALKAHQLTIETMPPTVTYRQKKKEKGPRLADDGVPKEKTPDEDNPALTAKVKLNSICMRIVKRALQKGETAYNTQQTIGGFNTILRLSCLPGEWAEKAWAGKVCTTKQAAEQSAAQYALDAIAEDETLTTIAEKGKPKEPKGEGKGKREPKGFGKGFGKGKFKGIEQGIWAPPTATGPELEREVLTPEPVEGEIIEWRAGGYVGWIKLDTPVDHRAALRREGRVYAHKQDLQCDADALKPGLKVSFILYVDESGLGAEQINLL